MTGIQTGYKPMMKQSTKQNGEGIISYKLKFFSLSGVFKKSKNSELAPHISVRTVNLTVPSKDPEYILRRLLCCKHFCFAPHCSK